MDAVGIHVANASLTVSAVGADACLGAAEADGVVTKVSQRHRQQGDGYQLARGEKEVQLAGIGFRGHRVRQVDQRVGGLSHRGDYSYHLVTGVVHTGDSARHVDDLFSVGNRAASVFVNIQSHWSSCSGWGSIVRISGDHVGAEFGWLCDFNAAFHAGQPGGVEHLIGYGHRAVFRQRHDGTAAARKEHS